MSGEEEEPQSVIAQVVPKATFVQDVETFVQGTCIAESGSFPCIVPNESML